MTTLDMDNNKLRQEHLVETAWLAEHLQDPGLRIVDMRGYVKAAMSEGGVQHAAYLGAKDEYAAGHIPGAVYLDWTSDIVDLDDPVPAQVAPPDKIARTLGEAGIGDDTLVVAYDNHPASQFATRLWWVLRYYGHSNVRVLNGGWSKWIRQNHPTEAGVAMATPAVFTPHLRPDLRTDANELLKTLHNPTTCLIDARDEGQYTGSVRRGSRGGHIPGAINVPRELLFNPDGTFQDAGKLQQLMGGLGISGDQNIVAYCNGGVAATSVLFTLSMLGYPSLSNYDGSWNEWSERPELPVET